MSRRFQERSNAQVGRTGVNYRSGSPPRAGTDKVVARKLGLVGRSTQHFKLLDQIRKIAGVDDVEVLITGPSGVGKELYAKFLHHCSRRCTGPFIAVNCGALPDSLFENEMFGHAVGAYTDASAANAGLVAAAEAGTLLLDEVDALAQHAQVKLLRLLQEREYRRLGETRVRVTNVRFIASTNTDLVAAMREGRFREDLFFRLRVVPVEVPPLCQRPEDVPPLLLEFAVRYADRYQLRPVRFSDRAWHKLAEYDWPGNVRELEDCVRSLTCQQFDRPVEPSDLRLLNGSHRPPSWSEASDPLGRPFNEAKDPLITRFERHYIEAALERTGGNIAQSARLSGKHRRAFFELMRKHEIDAARFRYQGS